ncbi:hypothetical protein SDC9_179008 [bioreactor metagenome]|uniref:Outer membrane protein beta-barrel domain-containing protein n=1 Tax=bioreactor metagenome TaxID=1076179 RepID=A0A645H5J0_9ZZZZ
MEYRTLDSNGYYILKVPNKIRRLYTLPLNIGMQRYISAGKLGNSFRPFVGAMAVPTLIWEMPYTQNWFNDVKYSRAHFRMGAGLQIGADFGAGNTTITTVKMQYIYTPFGGSGLESVIGSPIYNFGGFYISLGISY